MKKIYLMLMILISTTMTGQTQQYEQKYKLLVSKLGPAGVGIETVLNNWEKVDSTDEKLLLARFDYYFNKGKSSQIVTKETRKYLGMDPVLTLKDSLDRPVYYFQEPLFDDELYGQALAAADKAVAFYPDKLDFRFLKANAYIMYEKESPDMALAYLMSLAKESVSRKRPWVYGDEKVDDDFFTDAMQEYCYSLYSIGSQSAYSAFKALSELMYKLFPKCYEYLNNIGTYYMVAESDYKAALKCYNKVLKKNPDDVAALQNAAIAYRRLGKGKQSLECLEKLNRLNNK